jgi:hypothetical protein
MWIVLEELQLQLTQYKYNKVTLGITDKFVEDGQNTELH